MGPVAQAERHDAPGLIGEPVPGETAVVEDVAVGREDPVRQPVLAHERGQTFSTGLSSGDRGGSGARVMLSGATSLVETCQPARARRTAACAPGATACAISFRCSSMPCVVQRGRTKPAPLPAAGQIAPKI